MSRVLVVRRKASWVRRLGDFARNDLLEGVDTLASGVGGVHKMHLGG
jgi:hypothetical protein